MSAALLHIRIGGAGDILVFSSPLRVIYFLPHTLRRAFINHPDVVVWRRITTTHGLACVRWAKSDPFDFKIVNVREYLGDDAPPNTKGLKLIRSDSRQLIYLPCDTWPEQAATMRAQHPEITDVVTPRHASLSSRRWFELSEFVTSRVLPVEAEMPEPEAVLAEDLRQNVAAELALGCAAGAAIDIAL